MSHLIHSLFIDVNLIPNYYSDIKTKSSFTGYPQFQVGVCIEEIKEEGATANRAVLWENYDFGYHILHDPFYWCLFSFQNDRGVRFQNFKIFSRKLFQRKEINQFKKFKIVSILPCSFRCHLITCNVSKWTLLIFMNKHWPL